MLLLNGIFQNALVMLSAQMAVTTALIGPVIILATMLLVILKVKRYFSKF